jgi:parallel beta-helix repeat protein
MAVWRMRVRCAVGGPGGRGSVTSLRIDPRARVALLRLAAFLALAVPAMAHAATYYVDNGSSSCSPSGPGTEAQPYCTISAAIAAHNGPGVTILVKPGIYREQVTINASGTSSSSFVVQALGSPVRVDGADDFSSTGQWVPFSGDVYRAPTVNWSPLQVFKDGARLTPSTASPAALPANSFVYVSGAGLYVNAGGGNPGLHALLVGRRSYGFLLSGRSWVTIAGFQVAHNESRGIYLNSACTNITVSRDTISFANSYGIQSVTGTFHVIEYCQTSDNHLHGIGFTQGSHECVARFNESMRNEDPAIRRANGIYLNASDDNTLYGNRLHHNQDTGLHFSGNAHDNLSYDNRSWRNGDHGYDHINAQGTVHVHDTAFGNYKDGFSIEGDSPNTHVHNCIAVDNGLTTDEFDMWVDSQSSVGFVSDYNIFWNSTSQVPFKYIATKYATIAGYQAASGQDAHSFQVNPMFADTAAGDFHLMPGSPAIDNADSGTPDWATLDAEGSTRLDDPATPNAGAGPVVYADRGALEYRPNQAPVVTSPAAATVAENQLLTVTVTASDPDSDPITSLTAIGLPPGATFTPDSGNLGGTLTWTPDFAQAGSYSILFVAANAYSGTDTTVITVTNTDRAPVVTAPATATVAENQLLSLQVTAADPDGDSIQSLAPLALPPGATFTPDAGNLSGTLSWTPDFTQAGLVAIPFVAANALLGADTTLVTVTNTDRAPVVSAPATAGVQESQPLSLPVTAADPDGDPVDSLTAVDLPAGAAFVAAPDHLSGTLSWTPDFSQSGTYRVSFVAGNALAGADTTEITVGGSDRAPVVVAPAAASVAENGLLTFVVHALDPDADPIASLTANGLPPGATFTADPGDTTGTFLWTPDFSQAGSYPVWFGAANALSGADTTAITVTNTDRPPVVLAPPTAGVAETDSLTLVVTAHDPDGEPITSLVASPLPPGATFTADPGDTSGTFSWRPQTGQAGVYTVVFAAADGASGSDTTVITVSPPAAGVWLGLSTGPPLVPSVSPDPFRDRAQLRFATARGGPLQVQIFDLAGRVVRTLLDERDARAGQYQLDIDAARGEGRLAQGLYFYRIVAGEGVARGRFMVLR